MKNLFFKIALAFVLVASVLGPTRAQQGSSYAKFSQPWYSQGKVSGGIVVSTSSAATALPAFGFTAWVCNTGAADAYLQFGTSAVAATVAGSTWLKASTCASYDLSPPGAAARSAYIAAITGSSTTLTVETGLGSGPAQLVASGGGGGGGGTSSDFGSGFPAAGTAIGVKNGANMVNLTADGSSNLNVNCAVGCSGGTFNNNADGVATSSTNGQAAAWLYSFNGTTYDRVRGDTTNGLFVQVKTSVLPTGAATAALQTSASVILTSIDGKTPSLGQQLAAASSPVVLTAAQITTLTPPAAITGFALDATLLTTNVNIGVPGATTCSTDTGSCSLNALGQRNNQRLSSLISNLGSPFQVNGTIGNTAFGISGTLPAFAAIPAFKTDLTTPGTTNLVSIGTTGTVNPTTAANWGVGAFAAPIPANGIALGLFDGTNLIRAKGDETSGIWVNIKAGAGSGGTALADEAAFTQGSTSGTPAFGLYSTSVTNLTNGQAGAIRATNDRQMMVSDAATQAAIAALTTVAGNPLAAQAASIIIGGVGVPSWGGGTLGAMANYGTSPGAVLVPGVNAFITNTVAVSLASTTITGTVAATQSGAWTVTANAGTNLNTSLLALEAGGNLASIVTQLGAVTASPTANTIADRLKVINTTLGTPFQAGGSIGNTTFAATQATAASLNATVVGTGTFAVQAAQSGTWTVQPGNTANTTAWLVGLNTTPSLANGNGVVPTQGGAVLSATNGGYQNILQGNAVLSLTNPSFSRITDGTNGVTVKAASTPPVSTDTAQVVTLRPVASSSSTIVTSANGVLNVKASAGVVKKIEVSNNSATVAWLKLYNSASTPTAGAGTPVRRILIPGNSSGVVFSGSYDAGISFATGIGYALTGLIADADSTAVTASVLVVNIDYD